MVVENGQSKGPESKKGQAGWKAVVEIQWWRLTSCTDDGGQIPL